MQPGAATGTEHAALEQALREIDSKLQHARAALQEAHEALDRQAELLRCRELLQEVRSVLELLGIRGAAMLTHEMVLLAAELPDRAPETRAPHYETLSRALLKLPDYLERLLGGQRDHPVLLLGAANELREVRGAAALSPYDFFHPDLERDAPPRPPPATPAEGEVRREGGVRGVRAVYQAALLGLFRGREGTEDVAQLGRVITALEQRASSRVTARLWWVAGALVEALALGGISLSIPVKQLLGQLDQQIKLLDEFGEAQLARNPPIELLRGMLFQLAGANTTGPRGAAVCEAFELPHLLPDPAAMTAVTEALGSRPHHLLVTVAAAIRDELSRVKEALDLFVWSDRDTPADLRPQADTLRSIAASLSILDVGDASASALEQASVIDEIAAGAAVPGDELLLEVARALLHCEFALDELAMAGTASGGVDHAGHEAGDARLRALREAAAELAAARAGLDVQAPATAQAERSRERLQQVAGALRLLELEGAASVVDGLQRFLVCPERDLLPPAAGEALADALTALDDYFSAAATPGLDGEAPLAAAREALRRLAGATPQPDADGSAAADAPRTPLLAGDSESLTVTAAPPDQGAAPEGLADRHAGAVDGPPFPNDPQAASAPQPEASVPEPQAQAPAPGPEVQAHATAAAAPAACLLPPLQEIDQELAPIFLEEATEELLRIRSETARWRAEPANGAALAEVRRAFHTLKGSGRMVGAVRIGELAWQLENLLNHVLDGRIPAGPEIRELLSKAEPALEALIGEITGGPEASAEEIARWAERLAQPEASSADGPQRAEVDTADDGGIRDEACAESAPTPAPTPAPTAPNPAAASADPALLDIYLREAHVRLGALEALTGPVGPAGLRDALAALHTVQGISRTVGARHVAELGRALERMLTSGSLGEATQALLQEAVDLLHVLLASPSGDPPPAYAALLARLQTAELRTDAEDEDALEIFLDEAADFVEEAEATFGTLAERGGRADRLATMQRGLHTLKGGARTVGLTAIGDLAHALESLLESLPPSHSEVAPNVLDVLHTALDRLLVMLDQASVRMPVEPAPDLLAAIGALRTDETLGRQTAEASDAPPAAPALDATVDDAAPPPGQAPQTDPEPGPAEDHQGAMPVDDEPTAATPTQSLGDTVRVTANMLDSLVGFAAEENVFRSSIEQQFARLRSNLGDLDETVARLREQLRQLELQTDAQIIARYETKDGTHREDFDPLELDRYSQLQQLSRATMEGVSDVASLQRSLQQIAREAEGLLQQQARTNAELRERLDRARTMTFGALAPRLRRVVRQTCRELGKQAELVITGGDTGADRTLLVRLSAPLEHMLRNAIAHGIEAPELRRAAGKPETGTITLHLARQGSDLTVQVEDDGAGIDLDAVRRKAVERGLADPDADLSDAQALDFILSAGFSTAQAVTQVAGRGVGMDVAASEVRQLGGSLDVQTQTGRGTRFTIRVPFTLGVTRVIFVRLGEELYAVPLFGLEGIMRLGSTQLREYRSGALARLAYAGRDYEVLHTDALLGAGVDQGQERAPALLLRAGERRVALVASAAAGRGEIVVRSLGPQLAGVSGLAGATILGDGRVVLVLDIGALARRALSLPRGAAPRPAEAAAPLPKRLTVLVVDDSISARTVTARLLERQGMVVRTARDGLDAVAVLEEIRPDIMLLDIEMPRMDGYDVALHVRNHARLRDLPIIMITSRIGEKHRARAAALGVDGYLGKPYHEAELLERIHAVIGARASAQVPAGEEA
jgi:chemosensory pili system protein ChpA (sensor histidine kinase/response regulator)